MNTLFVFAVFALVMCSYAAPTSELAANEGVFSSLDDAKLQIQQNQEVENQEKNASEADTAALAVHVDNHSYEDARQNVGLKKVALKSLPGIKTRAKLYLKKKKQLVPTIQDDGTKLQNLLNVQAQGDGEDDDIAAIEAMIKKDAIAKWHHIKKTFNKVKSFTKKGLKREIQLASKYQTGVAVPVATSPAIQALLSRMFITHKLKANQARS